LLADPSGPRERTNVLERTRRATGQHVVLNDLVGRDQRFGGPKIEGRASRGHGVEHLGPAITRKLI
jgi:hypothetical protein